VAEPRYSDLAKEILFLDNMLGESEHVNNRLRRRISDLEEKLRKAKTHHILRHRHKLTSKS